MGKYVAESKFIASIFPGKLWPITKNVGPHPNPRSARATVYYLPQVLRGQEPEIPKEFRGLTKATKIHGNWVATIEVSDAFENIPNPVKSADSSAGDRIGSRMVFDSGPVPCEEIINNLLQEWAGGYIGLPVGALPGIMAIAGTVPTQAEMNQMIHQQTVLCEYLFQEGQRLNLERQWRSITNYMRDAAAWLGRQQTWSHPEKSTQIQSCPACKQTIPLDVSVCHICGTRIAALPAELESLNQAKPVQEPISA